MAQKTIGGISGVLGELFSPAPTRYVLPRHGPRSAAGRETGPTDSLEPPPGHCRRHARLDRLPGSNIRQMAPKEKVTLRIPSDLIAEYRDWS